MNPIDVHALVASIWDGPLAAIGAAWVVAALFSVVRLISWR